MKSAVVVDCVRTPVGRAHKERGYYRDVRSDDLAVACVRQLLERTKISPESVEDLVLGCTQQTLEQGLNVARNVGLIAGLAIATGGTTVNRLCGSSLQALHQATHSILAGYEDVQIVGGLEHMHHLPLDFNFDINPKLYQRTSKGAMLMGVTAEFLAQMHDISREVQDQYALRSHQKAAEATAKGEFAREMVPVFARDEAGNRILADRDQCIRSDTSLEALAALEPAFMPRVGTVTAGNSSPLNDGAAALLIMSEEKAKSLGLKPLVKIRATAIAGVEPCVMDA
jgi:acetyl-CoA acyltransferase